MITKCYELLNSIRIIKNKFKPLFKQGRTKNTQNYFGFIVYFVVKVVKIRRLKIYKRSFTTQR